MSAKPLIRRERSQRDVETAFEYYANEAGAAVARAFLADTERALEDIARHPATGSPRHGIELRQPGLRSRSLRRYPYLVFYVEHDDRIEVWRVLHAHRDIPAGLREP